MPPHTASIRSYRELYNQNAADARLLLDSRPQGQCITDRGVSVLRLDSGREQNLHLRLVVPRRHREIIAADEENGFVSLGLALLLEAIDFLGRAHHLDVGN